MRHQAASSNCSAHIRCSTARLTGARCGPHVQLVRPTALCLRPPADGRAFSLPLEILCRRATPVCQAGAEADAGVGYPGSLEARAGQIASQASNWFPLWVAAGALLGLSQPTAFAWFGREYITAGLSVTMLAMGTSLTLRDFTGVLQRPREVLLGAALQYTVMPALGFLISRIAGLPPPFAVGICIVACCPGGTASNLVTYLARADVALSVAMTTVSTLLAVATTPILTKLLVGTLVPVSVGALLTSTLQVVLAPVMLGAVLNQKAPRAVARVAPFMPLFAVCMVTLVCSSVIAQNAAAVRGAGFNLLAAIVALHAGGFALGYFLSKFAGVSERAARTNSIEVGMQNSALGALLATLHFPDPLTPVPCAISACMHSIIGSGIAAYWRLHDPDKMDRERRRPPGSAAMGTS